MVRPQFGDSCKHKSLSVGQPTFTLRIFPPIAAPSNFNASNSEFLSSNSTEQEPRNKNHEYKDLLNVCLRTLIFEIFLTFKSENIAIILPSSVLYGRLPTYAIYGGSTGASYPASAAQIKTNKM